MYSDLHVEQITPLLGPYTEAPHPDQQGLVLVQNIAKENFTVDPWGGTRWSTDAGSWQRMYPSGGGWFAYREDTKRLYFVTRVPKLPYMD